MEDNKIWFYIIAAIIYFFTRRKKKKSQQPTAAPTESKRPQQDKKPVSFEDLLKEITEGREEEAPQAEVIEKKHESVYEEEIEQERNTGKRHFADAESRRIYEQSIAHAAEVDSAHDHAFEPDDDYVSKKMFKGLEVEEDSTLADEIREGLQGSGNARKAIIYSEILNKKY